MRQFFVFAGVPARKENLHGDSPAKVINNTSLFYNVSKEKTMESYELQLPSYGTPGRAPVKKITLDTFNRYL